MMPRSFCNQSSLKRKIIGLNKTVALVHLFCHLVREVRKKPFHIECGIFRQMSAVRGMPRSPVPPAVRAGQKAAVPNRREYALRRRYHIFRGRIPFPWSASGAGSDLSHLLSGRPIHGRCGAGSRPGERYSGGQFLRSAVRFRHKYPDIPYLNCNIK